MRDQVLRQYQYKLSMIQGLFVLLLFGLFTYFGLSQAMHNDRGLIINHIIELSASMATYFWWGIAMLSLLFTILGLVMVIKSLQAPSFITLYDTSMTVPKRPISNTLLTIEYSDIKMMSVNKISWVHTLQIEFLDGKVVIPESNFVNKTAFKDMADILLEKWLEYMD